MEPATTLPNALQGASERSNTYRLIARLWLYEVDQELLQRLLAPPLSQPFVEAGGLLPSDADEQTVEDLSIDYCQIFIGPSGHLPPYQSVWETGQLQGSTIESMQQYINIAGYVVEAIPSRAMLDHLGIQLDVMGYVLEQVASGQFDSEALEGLQDFAISFFERHLSWPKDLLDGASSRATTDFYRSVIAMTQDFLESERDSFQDKAR